MSGILTETEIDIFLKDLKEIWKAFPELRFGQLIDEALDYEDELFFIEDRKLMEKMKDFYLRKDECEICHNKTYENKLIRVAKMTRCNGHYLKNGEQRICEDCFKKLPRLMHEIERSEKNEG